MKKALATLALLLLLSIQGWSNSLSCIDPTATPIGTGTFEMPLSSTCQSIWEITILRTSGGQIIYMISPESIHFSGSGDAVNSLTTSNIFAMISIETVSQGVALGYTQCPNSCSSPATATVMVAQCVLRIGSGTATSFAAGSGSDCCTRHYDVCRSNAQSAPVVTLSSAGGGSCSGAGSYESTCP